jgi:hypothetical protein
MRLFWQRASTLLANGLNWLGWSLIFVAFLAGDAMQPGGQDMPSRVAPYVRKIEFDFVGWTLNAIGVKVAEASTSEQAYLAPADRARQVRHYFDLIGQLETAQSDIAARYADPAVTDKLAATAALRAQAAELRAQATALQPLAEAILQEQIAAVFAQQGLALGGQTIPPVAFHFTDLPMTLIVSPRQQIQQAANVPIVGDLPLEAQVALEDKVAKELDVSTVVVGLGGIGTYPTMIAQSSYFTWIVTVGAHEWTHNYLTLRPLGVSYEGSPELRTMNETTAEIMGNEIGALVLKRYYSDLAPGPAPFPNILQRNQPAQTAPGATQPAFDFNAEMHATRVQADALLAQGKIAEAETYMETRRQFFWDHGYQIRKLNQAWFAFYGAYAAEAGGGAQGADPVGPAVLLLRRRSPSLKVFVNTMAGFTSFSQLQQALAARP